MDSQQKVGSVTSQPKEPAKQPLVSVPPTPFDRLAVLLRILHKKERLGLWAATLIGGGWIMVTTPTNISLGVTLIGAGLFFGIWWLFKEARVTKKYVIPILLIYPFLATPICRAVSWWLTIPPIVKTITVHNVNTSLWGTIGTQSDLTGKPILRWFHPPIIRAKFNQDETYGLLFLIGHEEYGSTLTCNFFVYLSEGLEPEPSLGWTTKVINDIPYHHFIRCKPISDEHPQTLPSSFSFKGQKPGRYPIRYEIRGIAIDANDLKTPIGVVAGQFIVELYE